VRNATGPEAVARLPSLDVYLRLRLGRTGWQQLRNVLACPLGAPTFAGFWRYWNPVYGYALLRFVYAPLRRWLPHPAASWLTFVACGLGLHDLVGWALARHVRAPEMTLLVAVFGAQAVAGEALGLTLAGRPFVARAAANLALLAAGWALALRVLVPLALRTGLFAP
jgi:hypothetical protein